MIVLIVASLLVLVLVGALVPLGLRAGDKLGDARLLGVEPMIAPRGASVTLTNPGVAPVMVGLSLRRAGPRLRAEGSGYVRIRTGSTSAEVLTDRQGHVGVLQAGEVRTFVVAADAQVPERAELVTIIGQQRRLRAIHRLVLLPRPPGYRRSMHVTAFSATGCGSVAGADWAG